MKEAPMLETPRLLLRSWKEKDLDAYARMCADPEVMRYTRSGVMTRGQTAEQVVRIADHWGEHGCGPWAVEEKASGAFIGRIGLMRYADFEAEPEECRTEVGFLLDRAYWGRGLATEGVLACLKWAFGNLDFDRMISIIRPANVRSRRVAERAGLALKGQTRCRAYDMVWYAIDRKPDRRPV